VCQAGHEGHAERLVRGGGDVEQHAHDAVSRVVERELLQPVDGFAHAQRESGDHVQRQAGIDRDRALEIGSGEHEELDVGNRDAVDGPGAAVQKAGGPELGGRIQVGQRDLAPIGRDETESCAALDEQVQEVAGAVARDEHGSRGSRTHSHQLGEALQSQVVAGGQTRHSAQKPDYALLLGRGCDPLFRVGPDGAGPDPPTLIVPPDRGARPAGPSRVADRRAASHISVRM
jgi:hypothetical protein